jgi:Fe-S oxidoreductase
VTSNQTTIQDISTKRRLAKIELQDLMKLPPPYDEPNREPPVTEPKEEWAKNYITTLDGYVGIDVPIPKPQTKEEEDKLGKQFLEGLRKLVSREEQWTFLQPLLLTLEYCARCQACSEACPIYLSSGRKEIYRPTYRAEVLRRIYKKYFTKAGKFLGGMAAGKIDLNWQTISNLAELSYRCTLCRRCAQWCPLGLDNGLVSREIRLLFSQEMGIANKQMHESGTVQQLKVGSSTGMTPEAFKNVVAFMEDEIEEKTGERIRIPVDQKGADYLLVHNAGEFLSWPENPEAFAIILDRAGINYTLSSDLVAYDAVNYGVWYDDIQLARIGLKHTEVARKLDADSIVVGECGHAHKALSVIMDRIVTDEFNIPRQSCLPLLWDIVRTGKLNLDSAKNNFPVTLHDPCNIVRLMGIVQPQRNILKQICPTFREMAPAGVYNYCCGGGSGFAIMQSMNFPEWRNKVATRMKFKQILEAFQDEPASCPYKYVCAPCSNCKGAIRDMLGHYQATDKCGINYGGLADLIVNAMVDLKKPFLELAPAAQPLLQTR